MLSPCGLVAGGVIAGFCENIERWQSLRRMHLNFNLPPTRIVRFIARLVSQNILIAKLHPDLGSDIWQIIQIFDGENAPASHLGHFGEQRGTVKLLRRAIAIREGIENADRVELSIRFLHETLDVVLVVAAMIIAAVRYDEQGAFGVVCAAHLAEPEIDGVKKSGSALRGSEHHAALELLDAAGERAGELSALVETHEEKFVGGIGGLEKLHGGFAGLADFVGHTAAEIEDHADG